MNQLLRRIALLCTLCPAVTGQSLDDFRFDITTLGGQRRTQADFKDNVVILDFWGTWCGPCRDAVPGLVELYKKYKHHGLEIVGLAYERGPTERRIATVRKFAVDQGITYTLALGTPEIQKQVIGFKGYPTMLFFGKGMKYDHIEVGFDEEAPARMEKWIRSQLGLEAAGDTDAGTPKAGSAPDKAKKAEKIEVPPGVIYMPGDHDTGFEFTVQGLSGGEIRFADYQGKKVILAFTSTWDHEARNTADLLDQLQERYGDKGVVVVAASMEKAADRKGKIAAIQDFMKDRKSSYTVLPVGLAMLKKVHRPSGIPFFLVFDEKGKLILRRKNNSKEVLLQDIGQAIAK